MIWLIVSYQFTTVKLLIYFWECNLILLYICFMNKTTVLTPTLPKFKSSSSYDKTFLLLTVNPRADQKKS